MRAAAAWLLHAVGTAAAAGCDVCQVPGDGCCNPQKMPPDLCFGAPCCACGTQSCVCAAPAPPPPGPPTPAPAPGKSEWLCEPSQGYTCAAVPPGTPGAKSIKLLCNAECSAPPPPATPHPIPIPPHQPGAHKHWDGTCFACTRFPEMANFTGTDLDWTTKGATGKVRRQFLTWDPSSQAWSPVGCWNCGVYAAVQDLESSWFMAGHDFKKLSIRQATDCSGGTKNHPGGPCEGGERIHYWDYLMKHAAVSQKTYPWVIDGAVPTRGGPQTCQKSKLSPTVAKVTGWFRLRIKGDDPVEAEQLLLKAVRKVGPISIGISSTHLHKYTKGVDSPGLDPRSTTGMTHCKTGNDHSVNLVGYGHDPASGKDYWKIQNEWGTDWGENGFYRLERGHNLCGIAWYAYHATVTPKDKYHCHADQQKCVQAYSGHDTEQKCEKACFTDEYVCSSRGTCVHTAGGVPRAACEKTCIPAPTPAPPAPTPVPPLMYGCFDGHCQPDPAGVAKSVCIAVCN